MDKIEQDFRKNMENAVKALEITNMCLKRALANLRKKPALRVVK